GVGVGVGVPIGVGVGVSSGEGVGVSGVGVDVGWIQIECDFPIIGIGANESREDDGTGNEDGEKRLHFFFLGNKLFGLRDAFFGGSIAQNRFRFGNERANYSG